MPSPSQSDIHFRDGRSTGPRRHSLLVVDDEEGPRQCLRIVLKDDYDILLSDNGAEAVEIARSHPISAAILDIRMSGMSGIELLHKLKELDPTIEVIMLTAYETVETARQALRLGACDYLTKPFDLSTIRESVAKAIERHTISREIAANNERLQQLQTEIQYRKVQQEMQSSRGDIYASVIHDINGPLTIISGFIELINSRVAAAHRVEGADLDIIKDRLSRIHRQVNSCVDLSRRYLSFLREKSAQQSTIRANQVLQDLRELLKVHPHIDSALLEIEGLEKDAVVEIGGTDLIQILLNLTINAFQSSKAPSRVRIKARYLEQPADVDSLVDSSHSRLVNREGFQNQPPLVALSVSDCGPGIAAETLQRIFEPYYTTKPPGQGTGLGLSIVHFLAKEARGAVYVETVLGQGTTFTLYLRSSGLAAE